MFLVQAIEVRLLVLSQEGVIRLCLLVLGLRGASATAGVGGVSFALQPTNTNVVSSRNAMTGKYFFIGFSS